MLDKKNYRYIANDEIVELTETEFKVLNKLIEANGDNVSHEDLLYELFGENSLLHTTKYISVEIHRITKKLKKKVLLVTKNTKAYHIEK